ncbi:MAG: DUF389 domain-containing protein [Bacteroidetes bacterium]|nr:DUF389 domain-containing protein [Bacteroidota bacterium]
MENQNKTTENQSQEINSQKKLNQDFISMIKSAEVFLKDLFDISQTTNQHETIERIKENIPMKGQTAWVLIFSIVIASIGLNVSSTAVVIGAMLVSPLMGPILGVGLSIGINDIDTLKKSFINLGVMVGLSLMTSFLFFSIPVFQDLTPELKARTYPDIRDVLIALSGGLALIIALSRHKEMTHTIAGIAIATALMPPLCTAGYGLAVGRLDYFGGAIFLFTINTIFIAIATFIIVKFLKFPVVKYLNSLRRKRIAQFASFVALMVLLPSTYMFYSLFVKNQFKNNAQHFIQHIEDKGVNLIGEANDESINYEKNEIKLLVFGETLSEEQIQLFKNDLPKFGLENTNLIFKQSNQDLEMKQKIDNLTELYLKNQGIINSREETIREKDDKIRFLEITLNKLNATNIAIDKIGTEVKINYPEVEKITFSNKITTNFKQIDTIPIITVKWNRNTSDVNTQHLKLSNWLKARLEFKKLLVLKE